MKNKKAKLRIEADKLWKLKVIKGKPMCEVCGQVITDTAHHFFPKSQYGHLRYNISNGVAICRKCHFTHHNIDDPTIHATIIEKRGRKWYNKLKEESRLSPQSYQLVSYYQNIINKLK